VRLGMSETVLRGTIVQPWWATLILNGGSPRDWFDLRARMSGTSFRARVEGLNQWQAVSAMPETDAKDRMNPSAPDM